MICKVNILPFTNEVERSKVIGPLVMQLTLSTSVSRGQLQFSFILCNYRMLNLCLNLDFADKDTDGLISYSTLFLPKGSWSPL